MRKQMCNPQSFVCNMGLGWTSLGVESLWFPPVSPRLWGDGVGGWWEPEGARSRSLGCLHPYGPWPPGTWPMFTQPKTKDFSLNHTSHAEGHNFVCNPQSFVCNMLSAMVPGQTEKRKKPEHTIQFIGSNLCLNGNRLQVQY